MSRPITAHDVADVLIFALAFGVLVYAAAGGWAG